MSSGWGRRGSDLLRGRARVTARGRRRDFFCCDYKGQRNLDVGLAGADGARTVAD